MSDFICPVCSKELKRNSKTYECENMHSFDISKSGYVNLLMSQQSKSKRHGDDKVMVRARRDFLDAGYYRPLLKGIIDLVQSNYSGGTILDAGCGECWYTSYIYEALSSIGNAPHILGVDISKNALDLASRRENGIERAVASIFNLPVANRSCDMLINIFAPHSESEFYRVLKPNGKLIRVIPLKRHLWQLKQHLYDNPYENTVADTALQGFEIIAQKRIAESIHVLNKENILNLFMMTPYYYKTSQKDSQKLLQLESLETEVEFEIIAYERM